MKKKTNTQLYRILDYSYELNTYMFIDSHHSFLSMTNTFRKINKKVKSVEEPQKHERQEKIRLFVFIFPFRLLPCWGLADDANSAGAL